MKNVEMQIEMGKTEDRTWVSEAWVGSSLDCPWHR